MDRRTLVAVFIGVILFLGGCASRSRLSSSDQAILDRLDELDRQIEAELEAERKAYFSQPNLDPEKVAAIRNKQIVVGMTEVEVRLSWGLPQTTKRQDTSWGGTYEYWTYKQYRRTCYLTFNNGLLKEWTCEESW